MTLIPMSLRLEAPDGIEEYRIRDGEVEVRQLEHPVEEDRIWYRLTPRELTAHVKSNSVVAQWLKHRIGWRRLLRACLADKNLFPEEVAPLPVARPDFPLHPE
jgi:hypothetical protein